MKRQTWACGIIVAALAILPASRARADILIKADGAPIEGKLISQNATAIVFAPDLDGGAPKTFDRNAVARVLVTDAHGAIVSDSSATTQPVMHWDVPPEPAAPAVARPAAGPTYYVIPLHGEVGVTVLASALDKSLADAVARRASVVILDIDSPGGLVEEAKKIIEVIHKYNKQARIVALANQDLSAAAILSLSCRQIYVKATGTIGAAVAYNPSNLTLPPKLEEKMLSAWRAVARNSAEEGGHEPLLAEAMIDNSLELHLETVAGKPVVKEGAGERTLCHKGKILTLSSHEAVECGLSAAQADDYAELGKVMGMPNWAECAGLGVPLADYLPKRAAAFKADLEAIQFRFSENMQDAINADPSRSTVTVITPPVPRLAPIPRRPGTIRRPAPAIPRQSIRIVSSGSPANWKSDSLLCVVALNDAETDLKQAHGLCDAFAQQGQAEEVNEARDRVALIRAKVFDARNRYASADTGIASNGSPSTRPADNHSVDITVDGRTSTGSYHREIHIEHNDGPPAAVAKSANGTVKTETVGGHGGGEFTTVSPTGAPVLGFRVTFGQWAGKQILRQVVPLFDRASSQPQPPDAVVAMARDGYVVSGIIANYDKVSAIALRVIFARYSDGVVDPNSTYTTDWIGKSDGGAERQLAGKGETVVGVCGRRGMNCDALGLVVLTAPAAPAPHPAAQVASTDVTPPPPPASLLPVPDAASQAKALKLVQEVHSPYPPGDLAARRDLAVKMLDEGRRTTDDAGQRYVLLREARDMAAGAGDWATAMESIKTLEESFPVDAIAMTTAVLNQAAAAQPAPAGLIAVALTAADRAIAADRYDDAIRAGSLAELWARNARDNSALTAAQQRLTRARDAQKDYAKYIEAMRLLKNNPADPNANLIAGRFKCFDKGDWEHGLALVAKGSDAALKAAAAADLAQPTTKAARMSVANGWWALSERAAGSSARLLQARAAFWYQQALPDVTTPLEKTLLEKRLAAAGANDVKLPTAGNAPDGAGAWVNLIPRIDLAQDIDSGDWEIHQGTLSNSQAKHNDVCRLTVPVKPTGDFALDLTFVRTSGDKDVCILFPVSGHAGMIWLGEFDGQQAFLDGSHTKGRNDLIRIVNGKPYHVELAVSTNGATSQIDMKINGVAFLSWSGDPSTLTVNSGRATRDGRTIGLAVCHSTTYDFTSVKVRPITGTIATYETGQ